MSDYEIRLFSYPSGKIKELSQRGRTYFSVGLSQLNEEGVNPLDLREKTKQPKQRCERGKCS